MLTRLNVKPLGERRDEDNLRGRSFAGPMTMVCRLWRLADLLVILRQSLMARPMRWIFHQRTMEPAHPFLFLPVAQADEPGFMT